MKCCHIVQYVIWPYIGVHRRSCHAALSHLNLSCRNCYMWSMCDINSHYITRIFGVYFSIFINQWLIRTGVLVNIFRCQPPPPPPSTAAELWEAAHATGCLACEQHRVQPPAPCLLVMITQGRLTRHEVLCNNKWFIERYDLPTVIFAYCGNKPKTAVLRRYSSPCRAVFCARASPAHWCSWALHTPKPMISLLLRIYGVYWEIFWSPQNSSSCMESSIFRLQKSIIMGYYCWIF